MYRFHYKHGLSLISLLTHSLTSSYSTFLRFLPLPVSAFSSLSVSFPFLFCYDGWRDWLGKRETGLSALRFFPTKLHFEGFKQGGKFWVISLRMTGFLGRNARCKLRLGWLVRNIVFLGTLSSFSSLRTKSYKFWIPYITVLFDIALWQK